MTEQYNTSVRSHGHPWPTYASCTRTTRVRGTKRSHGCRLSGRAISPPTAHKHSSGTKCWKACRRQLAGVTDPLKDASYSYKLRIAERGQVFKWDSSNQWEEPPFYRPARDGAARKSHAAWRDAGRLK
jgi:hypothetical protein